MELVLIFAIISLCHGDPVDVPCCDPNQGVLSDKGNKCVDKARNITSNTRLSCDVVGQVPIARLNYTITDDGRLIIEMENFKIEEEKDRFCIAKSTTNSLTTKLLLCADEEELVVEYGVVGYCMIVSAIFLCLTAGVYCLLSELWDIQGKSIVNFCVSLALGLTIIAIMNMVSYSDMKLCAARGFLAYFFIIASFFWSNAISIQMLLSIRKPTSADYSWKTFIWYALYAWGVPIILTVSMAIVNFYPGRHSKPGIGLNTCWFFSSKQQWQYMYSVISVLLLTNSCIFVYISVHLCRHTFFSSHIKGLKYKSTMIIRLLIVMGLPWILEMISSLFGPHIIWVITDIFNALQGILMFLVLVVFRRKVVKAMYERGWLSCISGIVERHLAYDDDEADVMQHTMDVGLYDRKINL